MENYESSVTISDDEDEYVPLISSTSTPPKIKCFSCYLCAQKTFSTERGVHLHIKEEHPHIYKEYSFSKRKCRQCNMILRSCSFRGLISHVVDKKCQVRLARQIAEMKNKKKFLEALSLGPNNNNGNNRPDNNQKVVSEPRKWIYGAPLPDKDPACGYKMSIPKYKKRRHPTTSVQSNGICTSFICSYRDEGVAEPCSECKDKRQKTYTKTKKKPICQDLPVKPAQQPSNKKPQLPVIPQLISSSSSSPIKPETRDLYNRALSAKRQSAVKANLKNCRNTVRKVKRLAKRKKYKIRRASNEENTADDQGEQRGKLVFRCKKEMWLDQLKQFKVLDDQSNDININKNFNTSSK